MHALQLVAAAGGGTGETGAQPLSPLESFLGFQYFTEVSLPGRVKTLKYHQQATAHSQTTNHQEQQYQGPPATAAIG
jgi:hypothetical protein